MPAAILLVLTLLVMRRMRRRNEEKYLRYLRLLLGVETIALLLFVFDWRESHTSQTKLQRPDMGETERVESLELFGAMGNFPVQLHLTERELSPEEEEASLQEARRSLEQWYVSLEREGENHLITEDLQIPRSLEEDRVQLDWQFQPEGLIEGNGSFHRELLAEDQKIRAEVEIRCGGQREGRQYDLLAKAYPIEKKEGYMARIQARLAEEIKNSAREEHVLLPQKDGQQEAIVWRRAYPWRAEKLLLLGLCLAGLLFLADQQKVRQARKEQKDAEERDYPQIVSELSLYVSAGIRVHSALERMAHSYERSRVRGGGQRAGYESLLHMLTKIRNGQIEEEAYQDWPNECQSTLYRKLSILLLQERKRGEHRLGELLEEERLRAEEVSRLRMKTLGEEASTKLLLPMVGLLAVILILLMAPILFTHL